MRGHPVVVDGVAGFEDVAAGSDLYVHDPFQDQHELLCGMGQWLLTGYGVGLETPQGDLHASVDVGTEELIVDRGVGHDQPAAPVVTNHRVWALQEEVVDGDFKRARYCIQGLDGGAGDSPLYLAEEACRYPCSGSQSPEAQPQCFSPGAHPDAKALADRPLVSTAG